MFRLTLTRRATGAFSRLFKDRIEALVFFTGFLVEMSFGLYLVWRYGCTYIRLGDNLAHLYISRAVAEGGGIGQLGTVWLPFFHILLVPFVSIDILYTTGLAGTIVNSFMTGGICALLYRLVGSRWGVIASALFLVNVNVLIQGGMQYMQPTGVFFMLLAVYYFKRYLKTEDLIPYIYCSLALILGTLTRYEVWPVALLATLIFVIKEIRRKRAYRLSYSHFPFWGIFAWLFYNLAIFRDPLMWFHFPPTGPGGGYGEVLLSILVPSVPDFLAYGVPSMIMLSGFLWMFLPIVLLISLIHRDFKNLYVTLLLMTPLVVFLTVHYEGHIFTPHTYCSLPGIILPPMFIVRNNKHTKIALIMCLIIAYSIAIPQQYTLNPPLDPSSYLSLKEEMTPIKKIIGGGSYVLADARGSRTIGRSLSVLYAFPQSKIINEDDGSLFGKTSKNPWQYCDFVMIAKQTPDSASLLKAENDYYGGHFLYLYYCDSEWHAEFLEHYEFVLESGRYLVYQKISEGGS